MYNGIGLSSARGTATSGYVQRSKGHVNRERQRRTMARNAADGPPRAHHIVSAAAREQGNIDLQEHERKRQLENQLLIMREEMEEEGIVDEDIEQAIAQRRQETYEAWKQEALAQKPSSDMPSMRNPLNPPDESAADRNFSTRNCFNCGEPGHFARSCPQPRRSVPRQRPAHTHLLDAAHKKDENKKLANALGIQQDRHREGAAFDRELIEQKREERRKEREKLAKKEEKEKKKREKLESKRAKMKKGRRRRSPSVSSSDDSSGSSSSSSSSRSISSSSMSASSCSSGFRRRRRRSYSSSSRTSSSRSQSRSRDRKRSQDSSSSSSSSYSSSSNGGRRRPSDRRRGRSRGSSRSESPRNDHREDDTRKNRSRDDENNDPSVKVDKLPEDNSSRVEGRLKMDSRSVSHGDGIERAGQSPEDVHHVSDARRRQSSSERGRSRSRSTHSSSSGRGASSSSRSSRKSSSSESRAREAKDHQLTKKRDRASRRASSTPSSSTGSESSRSSAPRRRKRRGRAYS